MKAFKSLTAQTHGSWRRSVQFSFFFKFIALFVMLLFFTACPDDDIGNSCIDVICQNGGTVQPDCICQCPEGFTGNDCSTQLNPCENVTCLNGGTVLEDCSCQCPEGFTGNNCEIDICQGKECNGFPCDEGACVCPLGYVQDDCSLIDDGGGAQSNTTAAGAYLGVWRGGDEGYYLWTGADWSEFKDKWQELAGKNLRLIDLDVYEKDGQKYYNGVWIGGNDKHYLYRYNNWGSFVDKWEELNGNGVRLIDIETFKVGDKRWYAGVWRSGTGGYGLFRYNNWSSFTEKWSDLADENLRLIDVETFKASDGKRWYIGVWREGTDKYALYQYDNWSSFTEKWSDLANQNLRLIDVETYKADGKRWYVGAWRQGTDGYALYQFNNWNSFKSKWKELGNDNKRLIDLEKL